ncbi:MAG TPA: PadR family transcriptional regulator [Candidatus Limnocylindria bacterium]|nr:PadR family transcriptional regulator [Candidatus Limnocylindria bacterium]
MSLLHAILGELAQHDEHGYHLGRIISQRLGDRPVNMGQIHEALSQLERRGWARAHALEATPRPRRRFTITEAGRAELRAWLRQPAPIPRLPRDAILTKLVLFGERDGPRLVQELLARKAACEQELRDAPPVPAGAPTPQDVLRRLAAERHRLHLEAELAWTVRCIEALQRFLPVAPAAPATEVDALHAVPPPVRAA